MTLHCHIVERGSATRPANWHANSHADSLADSHLESVPVTLDDSIADTITLDETDRHRRRFAMVSDHGIDFLLELQSPVLLLQDDVLRLSDGRGIRVLAKPEPLYSVHARDPLHLLMLAWHVGNRHLATQIEQDHFLIRRDPVIRTMLEELGAVVTDIECGFNPLGGAYDNGHGHVHSHPAQHTHAEE
ncbi:MAG: urease accessory protein UreE [Granulosicoccus sp.]|nr:urease accessory protein UreE [Granulosicoccus sp.]